MSNQKSYSDKLKDPRWQKKRLEIFNRDQFRCVNCFNNEQTLHVHHKDYIPGKEPWEYENIYLATLCEECHTHISENRPVVEKLIISALRMKINSTFIYRCVLDIFNETENLHDLMYSLWELKNTTTEKKIIDLMTNEWVGKQNIGGNNEIETK